MRNLCWSTLFLAVLAVVGSGCSKAGSTTSSVSAVTYLSVIHGAPYSGPVTIYLNDTLVTPTAINTGVFSPKYGTIRPGTYTTKFKKATNDSLLDQLAASKYDTLNFYTLLLYNDPGGKAAHCLKIVDDYSGVANTGYTYYRFFHLAPDFPKVNLYFDGGLMQQNRTPADNALNTNLDAFQQTQAGSYTVTVKDATTDSVVAKSNPLTFASGYPYTIWVTGTKAQNNLSINVLQAQY